MSSLTASAEGTSAIAPRQKFEGHTAHVWGVIHLPDGERIITCSRDGSLRVWNLESGKQIGRDWRDGETRVWTIALSPDGKKVVSGSEDCAVRLWDIDTCKVIAKLTGHREGVTSVCWSQDGQRVLSGSDDRTARQWNVESGETIHAPIKTGSSRYTELNAVVYSPDMTMFATGGYHTDEYFIKIWKAKTGELVAALKGHKDKVCCLAWTMDGKTLISGSHDHSIRTWNTTTWKQLAILDEHTNRVIALAISPNGRILASGSLDDTTLLWNLNNGQPITSPLKHPGAVGCVSFSEDGNLLATGCADNNTYTWDVATIVRDAGLDDLLKDSNKALLDRDATRRPTIQRRPDARYVPPASFFNDSPDRAHFSSRHRSSAPHGRTFLGRISSIFSRTHSDAHDTPSRPRPLDWARLTETPNDAGTDLPQCRSAEVDVPFAQEKRRNASAREKRRPIPLTLTNATAGISQSSVSQQSSSATHLQPSSQLHAAVTTSPAFIATSAATTSPTSPPDITIGHAGRWTRFWLFMCCASAEYANN